MGVTTLDRPRSAPSARGTVAALVLVVLVVLQMVVSLAFPAAVPRLVVLPKPATQVERPEFIGCAYDETTTRFERRLVFWWPDDTVQSMDACAL